MKLFITTFCIIVLIFFQDLLAQQINISRIQTMPNHPEPFLMRNWKEVAFGYDSLVFNSALTGQHLPLIEYYNSTVNYTNHGSFKLHTVVGTTSPESAEAINLLPAVIGATLAGIDKSDQHGKNFVLMCEEFFNRRPAENVYLNHPVSTSGDDWWYETMPNVFFYQLYDLYPGTGDFEYQFVTVADRWLESVAHMGGKTTPWAVPNMNYRAWELSTMTPNISTVKEPEAAGAIAWILYNAFVKTGDDKYRIGAEWCLEFLSSLSFNPSYEIQLPYGALTAARMNAEIGTSYNIEKLVNWCFSNYANRNWGTILGNWGGYDVSGLIGETDSDGYAFLMNTFQQAGALVPLVRYDDRFARAIGKWMLNASNASRLFYREFLPAENQDSYGWSLQYDPESYIAHESMRQSHNGKTPFATGDAISGGWGLTNLALYSSSHVGIFGGIIEKTNIERILKLDLRTTDYFNHSGYPSYLIFNPYNESKTITVNVGRNTVDIYDAVSNTFITRNASDSATIDLPPDAAVIAVFTPVGGTVTYELNKMLIDGIVVDYNSGQSFNSPPRIKSLSAGDSIITKGDSLRIYCTAVDKDGDQLSYIWQSSGGSINGSSTEVIFNTPAEGEYLIICSVSDGKGGSASDTLIINAVHLINNSPKINYLKVQPRKININSPTKMHFSVEDPDQDSLTFAWGSSAGNFLIVSDTVIWHSPSIPGNYFLTLSVSDGLAVVKDSVLVIVRDFSQNQTGNLVLYLPFNGNAVDESGNNNEVFLYQALLTSDRFNNPDNAYFFDGADDHIQIKNTAQLNFQNSISINFWIKFNSFFEREAYPVSHGNWENRWKISITNKKIRWTIKTNSGIKDIDSETELKPDSLYNITAVYSGSDFEIYINGELDAYAQWEGSLNQTTNDLMIGQSLPGNYNYGFRGMLDEIRIYDYAVSMNQVKSFYDLPTSIDDEINIPRQIMLHQNYPNPFNPATTVSFDINILSFVSLKIYDILGNEISSLVNEEKPPGRYEITFDAVNLSSGVYFYKLISGSYIETKKMILLR